MSASAAILSLTDTSVIFFRTVWRKTQSGLQFWGTRWLHKNTKRVQCPHYQFERGDYSLQITNVKLEDAGLFSCRVDTVNRVNKHQVMLRIIQGIKINPSPQISVKTHNIMYMSDIRNIIFCFTVSVSPSVPMWESQFFISCNVTPQAEGATVQWTLSNSSMSEAIEISQNASTLSVVSGIASASLTGNWTCVVDYKGEVGRASATLTLKGKHLKIGAGL